MMNTFAITTNSTSMEQAASYEAPSYVDDFSASRE